MHTQKKTDSTKIQIFKKIETLKNHLTNINKLLIDTKKTPIEKKNTACFEDETQMKEFKDKVDVLIKNEKWNEVFTNLDFLYLTCKKQNKHFEYQGYTLFSINYAIDASKQIIQKRQQLLVNFIELVSLMEEKKAEFVNALGQESYEKWEILVYLSHSDMFGRLFMNHKLLPFDRLLCFKQFVFCYLRRIQLTQNAVTIQEDIDTLNEAVYQNGFLLPKPSKLPYPLKNEELVEWHEKVVAIINSAIDKYQLPDPDRHYKAALECIVKNNNYYPKEVETHLTTALKDCKKILTKTEDDKIKEIKITLLLARYYCCNNLYDVAVQKYQATVNQITALNNKNTLLIQTVFPEMRLIYIELICALVNDHKIARTIKIFDRFLEEKNYAHKSYDSEEIKFFQKILSSFIHFLNKQDLKPEEITTFLTFLNKIDEKISDKIKQDVIYKKLALAYSVLNQDSRAKACVKKIVDEETRNTIEQVVTAMKKNIKPQTSTPEKKLEVPHIEPKEISSPVKKILPDIMAAEDPLTDREKQEKHNKKIREEKERVAQQKLAKKAELAAIQKEREEEIERRRIKKLSEFNQAKLKKEKPNKDIEQPRNTSTAISRKKAKKLLKKNPPILSMPTPSISQASIMTKILSEDNARRKMREQKQKLEETKKAVIKLRKAWQEEAKEKFVDPLLEEKIRQETKENQQRAIDKIKKANIMKNKVHAQLLEVALSLYKKDGKHHNIIKRSEILNQLKSFHEDLKNEPLLAPYQTKLSFKGISVLEFYLTLSTGKKRKFDTHDLDLVIFNAPKMHVAKGVKPLRKKQIAENLAHQKFVDILKKYQFGQKDSATHSPYFSNYFSKNNQEELELTIAHKKYKSNDPFLFTRNELCFSEITGLEFIKKDLTSDIDKLILDCIRITNTKHVSNFPRRLLKYYEKGRKNNCHFGENFKNYMENPEYQYEFFLLTFKQNGGVDNFFTLKNFNDIKNIFLKKFLTNQNLYRRTVNTAKSFVYAFCRAAYFTKFNKEADPTLLSALQNFLITRYTTDNDKIKQIASDICTLFEGMDQPGFLLEEAIKKLETKKVEKYSPRPLARLSIFSPEDVTTTKPIEPALTDIPSSLPPRCVV